MLLDILKCSAHDTDVISRQSSSGGFPWTLVPSSASGPNRAVAFLFELHAVPRGHGVLAKLSAALGRPRRRPSSNRRWLASGEGDFAGARAAPRRRAEVENPIRNQKDCGLERMPSAPSPPAPRGWSWSSPPPIFLPDASGSASTVTSPGPNLARFATGSSTLPGARAPVPPGAAAPSRALALGEGTSLSPTRGSPCSTPDGRPDTEPAPRAQRVSRPMARPPREPIRFTVNAFAGTLRKPESHWAMLSTSDKATAGLVNDLLQDRLGSGCGPACRWRTPNP